MSTQPDAKRPRVDAARPGTAPVASVKPTVNAKLKELRRLRTQTPRPEARIDELEAEIEGLRASAKALEQLKGGITIKKKELRRLRAARGDGADGADGAGRARRRPCRRGRRRRGRAARRRRRSRRRSPSSRRGTSRSPARSTTATNGSRARSARPPTPPRTRRSPRARPSASRSRPRARAARAARDGDALAAPPPASSFPAWAPRAHFGFEVVHRSRKPGSLRAPSGASRRRDGGSKRPLCAGSARTRRSRRSTASRPTRAGTQLMFCNTYHLLVHPGADVVAKAGAGLHRFMRRDGPIITDSGGFQVFSLADVNDDDGPELKKKHARRAKDRDEAGGGAAGAAAADAAADASVAPPPPPRARRRRRDGRRRARCSR